MRSYQLFLLVLPFFALACSANTQGQTQGSSGSSGSSGSAGSSDVGGFGGSSGTAGAAGSFGGGPGTGGGPSSDCSAAATYVYVLSDANDLYSFQPDKKIFTKIGPLGCKTTMLPNSMAIDRNATAWVNYVEGDPFFGDTAGAIFRVSTKDASCESAPAATLPADWYRLGMGFSTDGQGTDSETLYVAGTGSDVGLGKIDTSNGSLSQIGPFTGNLAGQNAELTGTGDGRLYGFFTTTPVEVAEINKSSGAIVSSKPLNGVETPAAWAFSFWGGDFYLYTAPDPALYPNRTTNVTHYRPGDGTIDPKYMENIGFRIVGAGVSTCAPLEPPK